MKKWVESPVQVKNKNIEEECLKTPNSPKLTWPRNQLTMTSRKRLI